MKKLFFLILITGLIFSVSIAQKKEKKPSKAKTDKIELKTTVDSVGYAYGLDIAKYFEKLEAENIKISFELLIKGITDCMKNEKTLIDYDESARLLSSFAQEMQSKLKDKQEKMRKELAVTNLAESEKFMNDNKSKEGVKVTASGLQYKIIKEGSGKTATLKDTVSINWTGKTLKGQVFVDSYQKNEPAVFALSNQFDGLKEALQLMNIGSKYQFFIPSSLGFGEMGEGPIEPNAAMIFEIELVKIN